MREAFLTDEETSLITSLLDKKLKKMKKESPEIDSALSAIEKITNGYLKKRLTGECGRSGAMIFIDEEGQPESRTIKCEDPDCEHIWKSFYVETWCPKCNS